MMQPVSPHTIHKPDEFFIGWLGMPPGYTRFLKPIAIALLLIGGGTAVLVGLPQQSPGPAEWDSDKQVTFEGIVYATPYAMIRVSREHQDDPIRTILLVEEGKFGAVERVHPHDGQPVRVTGMLLHRDERWMLELLPGEAGIQPLPGMKPDLQRRLRRSERTPLGQVTLRGEIVDSKCYLGAMKPGGGKTHKACAALCLSGGVPPMFVTRDPGRGESFYLLTNPDGGPIEQEMINFVGDPVELTGQAEKQGDLQVLKVAAKNIRRR
jgi:hypothetical protein